MVMAFLSDIAGGGVGAAANYLVSRSVTASLINAALGEGVSPTALLRMMRTAGLGMRTQNFYRLVGQVRTEGARLQNIANVLIGGSVTPNMVTMLSGGKAGQYMVNVKSFFNYIDENGDLVQETRVTSILQSEVDPLGAIRDTSGLLSQMTEQTYEFMGPVTGMAISGIYQWTGTA